MIHGVMLAAGGSTRLPNKALLPIKNGKPCIVSGLELLERSCQRVHVVTSPPSCIPSVIEGMSEYGMLDSLGNYDVVYQERALGVVDALRCLRFGLDDIVVVTFCDNVFDDHEVVPLRPLLPYASVRKVEGALDGHDGERWVDRSSKPEWKLAGWFVLRQVHIDIGGTTSVDFLNRIEAKPVAMPYEWHDIGTMDAYKEYWA